jgi:ribosomal protein S18 acetylase RimI-like enzyme
VVELVPMTQQACERFLRRVVVEYAEANVSAGRWAEAESLERSRDEFDRLLPDGVATPAHYLFTARDEQLGEVGVIWFHHRTDGPEDVAFIYDLSIDEQYRGRGLGRQTMLALEPKVRELGISLIQLHVFGDNTVARSLYERIGYLPASIQMTKRLDEDGAEDSTAS